MVTFIMKSVLTDCRKQIYFITNQYAVMKEKSFDCHKPQNTTL